MKLRPSLDFLRIVGQISGIVIAPRQGDLIARRKYAYRPPTPKQLAVRQAFTDADAAWRALDEPHKQAWRDWKPWYMMLGYSLFMRVNIPRVLAGQPVLSDPPDYPPWV